MRLQGISPTAGPAPSHCSTRSLNTSVPSTRDNHEVHGAARGRCRSTAPARGSRWPGRLRRSALRRAQNQRGDRPTSTSRSRSPSVGLLPLRTQRTVQDRTRTAANAAPIRTRRKQVRIDRRGNRVRPGRGLAFLYQGRGVAHATAEVSACHGDRRSRRRVMYPSVVECRSHRRSARFAAQRESGASNWARCDGTLGLAGVGCPVRHAVGSA